MTGYTTEVINQALYANLGDSHAGLGLLDQVAVLASRPLRQITSSVGGETSAQTAVRASDIASTKATTVVIQTGTNYWRTSTAASSDDIVAQMQTDFQSIVTALRATNKAVRLLTVPPSGNTQQPAITNRQVRGLLLFNEWLRSTYAPPNGVRVVDCWSAVAEPIATPSDNADVWYRAGFSIRGGTVSAGGANYGPNTRIDLTHNGGQGGALSPTIVNGALTAVSGTLRGYDYSSSNPPTAAVVDPDGGGSGATVTVQLTGGIVGYTINNGGTGVAQGAAISAPQGGAASHQAHCVVDGNGTITSAVVDVCGFGYSSTPSASVASGSGVSLTPIMGSPFMWKTQMTTGDTHEVLAGLQAEAAVLYPLL